MKEPNDMEWVEHSLWVHHDEDIFFKNERDRSDFIKEAVIPITEKFLKDGLPIGKHYGKLRICFGYNIERR